jgi:hypothetical protein
MKDLIIVDELPESTNLTETLYILKNIIEEDNDEKHDKEKSKPPYEIYIFDSEWHNITNQISNSEILSVVEKYLNSKKEIDIEGDNHYNSDSEWNMLFKNILLNAGEISIGDTYKIYISGTIEYINVLPINIKIKDINDNFILTNISKDLLNTATKFLFNLNYLFTIQQINIAENIELEEEAKLGHMIGKGVMELVCINDTEYLGSSIHIPLNSTVQDIDTDEDNALGIFFTMGIGNIDNKIYVTNGIIEKVNL